MTTLAPRVGGGASGLTDAAAAQDPQAYNRPYRLGGTGMSCFFRDDALSDLIGFTYATWHGDDAAANLVNELVQLARDYGQGGNHAVLIALDGENAWEHYPFNGYYFLRALYAQLADHPRLELTTLSDCLARGPGPQAISFSPSSLGRAARTSDRIASTTESPTGSRRTSRCAAISASAFIDAFASVSCAPVVSNRMRRSASRSG